MSLIKTNNANGVFIDLCFRGGNLNKSTMLKVKGLKHQKFANYNNLYFFTSMDKCARPINLKTIKKGW